jgi:hypothetical protein
MSLTYIEIENLNVRNLYRIRFQQTLGLFHLKLCFNLLKQNKGEESWKCFESFLKFFQLEDIKKLLKIFEDGTKNSTVIEDAKVIFLVLL